MVVVKLPATTTVTQIVLPGVIILVQLVVTLDVKKPVMVVMVDVNQNVQMVVKDVTVVVNQNVHLDVKLLVLVLVNQFVLVVVHSKKGNSNINLIKTIEEKG